MLHCNNNMKKYLFLKLDLTVKWQLSSNQSYICVADNGQNVEARFAVTVFTSRKNGGKLPVTEGKPDNYHLPIGKKSVYQQRFFTVKFNFQWWHLDAKVTHSPGKLLVNMVNHGKTAVIANLAWKYHFGKTQLSDAYFSLRRKYKILVWSILFMFQMKKMNDRTTCNVICMIRTLQEKGTTTLDFIPQKHMRV